MMLSAIIYSTKEIIVFDSELSIQRSNNDYVLSMHHTPIELRDENFYSKHLKNLCCIVGRNGTGKTSIIKDIITDENSSKNIAAKIYKDSPSKFIVSSKHNINITSDDDCTITFEEECIPQKSLNFIFYSNSLEYDCNHYEFDNNLTTTYLVDKYSYEEMVRDDMNKQFRFLSIRDNLESFANLQPIETRELDKNEIDDEIFNFFHKSVRIEISPFGKSLGHAKGIFSDSKDNSFFNYLDFNIFYTTPKFEDKYSKKLFSEEKINIRGYKEYFKMMFSQKNLSAVNIGHILLLRILGIIFLNAEEDQIQKFEELLTEKNKTPKDKAKKFDSILRAILSGLTPTINIDQIKQAFNNILYIYYLNGQTITTSKKFELEYLTQISESSSPKNEKKDIFNYKVDDRISYFIDIMYSGDKEIRKLGEVFSIKWNSISYGEYNFLNMFGRINHYIKEFSQNTSALSSPKLIDFIILIDEIDLGLHPSWQLNWMNLFLRSLNTLGVNIQLIMTTHSPLLLSDINKRNVIYLKEYKAVDTTNKLSSFGQNVNTLLADGFFVDSLTGRFSKEKIQEIAADIKSINGENSEEFGTTEIQRLKNLISIVGDPLYQNILLRTLSDKLSEFKVKDSYSQFIFDNLTVEERKNLKSLLIDNEVEND